MFVKDKYLYIRKILAFVFSFICVFLIIINDFYFCVNAENSGVNFSEAYIYDMLTGEMVNETPFVDSNRKDFQDIYHGLELGMMSEGISFAGAYADEARFNAIQAKNMVDYANKGKAIYENMSVQDPEFLGKVKYYKGEPYFCDTKNARFFRLTDDMKNELSESEIKGLIGEFSPGLPEYQVNRLWGDLNQNYVNTILYYTGEVPQAMSDLIDMYQGMVQIQNQYDELGQSGSYVNIARARDNGYVYSAPYKKSYAYGTVRNLIFLGTAVDPDGTFGAIYWRGAYNGTYYATDEGHWYGINGRVIDYYRKIDSGAVGIAGTWVRPYGYPIGSYGQSKIPFHMPNVRGCVSDNAVYDWDNVVAPAIDGLNDDVADTWDNNPFGYFDGTDDNGMVTSYDSSGNVTNNNYYIYAPTINYIYNFNIDIGGGDGGGGSGGGGEGGGGSGGGDTPSVSFPWHFDVAVPVEIQIPDDIPDVDIEPELPNLNFGELKDYFPFCIPFDIWYCLSWFVDPDAQPVFDVPFHIEYQGTTVCDYNFHLDMRNYGIEQIVFYLRAVQIVGFILFLCYLTFKPRE